MENIANILFIGDLHFKVNNNDVTDIFIEKTLEVLSEKKKIFNNKLLCVIGGDILDTHERLHQTPYNKAIDFIKKIKVICPLVILVGNHDYENNQQFLTNKHWMNPLKEWENVFIADKVLSIKDFLFVPYVPPGKFLEALDTYIEKDWRDSKCIFAHQEFRGCKMSENIISDTGDKWPEHYPMVISGHIHKAHRPQKNIIYPGSIIQHSFGEQNNETGLLFIDFEEEDDAMKFQKIQLAIPIMTTLHIDSADFEKTLKTLKLKPLQRVKIVCSGNDEQFKKIRKMQLYQNLPIGVTVSFKNLSNSELLEQEPESNDFENFESILSKILSEKSSELNTLFTDVINGKSFEEIFSDMMKKDEEKD